MTSAIETTDLRPTRNRFWMRTALAVLAVAAFSATCTQVWNFDIFWHLASGDWMLANGRVLDFDPFSVDPEPQWINIHWFFQLVVSAGHALGGFGALAILKAALGVLTVFVFAWHLRRDLPPWWLIVSGVVFLLMIAGRVRARPESFTLLFLTLTIALIESVRKGAKPKRLWWLVPIMCMWVNMHCLFILGLALIWSAVLFTWIDGKFKRTQLAGKLCSAEALSPIIVATFAILLSPWPLRAAIHPLLLWTRVSGQAFHYTYGVSELKPTWMVLGDHKMAILIVALAITTMAVNAKRLPIAHAVWMVMFAGLAAIAKRNVGLAGPVVAYLLAWHGAAIIKRIAGHLPRLKVLSPYAAASVTVLVLLLSFGVATGRLGSSFGGGRQFGPGLQQGTHPIAAAKFLGELPGGGDIFCTNFGDASTFIYYSYPARKLYMDGRLEAHSLERFDNYRRISTALRTVASARTAELPETVRFFFVRHDSQERLNVLAQSKRFQLVYLDEAGAVFARTDWTASFDKLPAVNFADFDRPLNSDGTIEGFDAARKTFWKQNPISMNYQAGSMLTALGQYVGRGQAIETDAVRKRCTLLAVRHLTAAEQQAVVREAKIDGKLAKSLVQLSFQENALPSENFPVDFNLARALAIYSKMDLADLSTPNRQGYAQYHILALKASGQLDVANKAMAEFLDNLPPQQRLSPPKAYLKLKDTLAVALELAQAKKARLDKLELPPIEKARLLANPDIGLMSAAIEELNAIADPSAQEQLVWADLLLRQGLGDLVFPNYLNLDVPEDRQWQLALGVALCYWVCGEFSNAIETFEVEPSSNEPVYAYYHAALLEQLGRYGDARARLSGVHTPSNDLGVLLKKLRKRLKAK